MAARTGFLYDTARVINISAWRRKQACREEEVDCIASRLFRLVKWYKYFHEIVKNLCRKNEYFVVLY
jgi:hypothetical protein